LLSIKKDFDFFYFFKNLFKFNSYPVLIEDIDETLDPSIEPILAKNYYEEEGRKLMKIFGDKIMDYHNEFRLYMTTKKPNPKYLPEIFIKVTVINFTATFEGLEDQMLAYVVVNEKPEVEEKRNDTIENLSNYKKKIEESEKNILKLLADA
jgi:dynein heavy chain